MIKGIFYKNTDSNIFGRVECIDTLNISNSISYLIFNFEESNCAIHGDIVEYNIETKKINKIISRTNKIILGILKVSSNIILSVNKRGVAAKLFVPYDKKYPSFSVNSKNLGKNNVYMLIKFGKWNVGSKYPIGHIHKVIGQIGKYKSELQCLKIKNNVLFKDFNKSIDFTDHNEYFNNDLTDNLTNDRVDFTNLTTISIDPPNCKDIDDALHCEIYDDKKIVGVHIADVSSFIPLNSKIDLLARNRAESVYLTNEIINMLPEKLSFDKCSLLEGKKRRTFSVIFTFDNEYNIIDVKFVKAHIINKKALSYDEAENMINSTNNSTDDLTNNLLRVLLDLYKIGKNLYVNNYVDNYINSNDSNDSNYNTHKMVEIFMILTNVHVAKKLIEVNPNKTILRIHNGLKKDKNLLDCKLNNKKLDNDKLNAIKRHNIMKMESAEYKLFDDIDCVKNISNINNDKITHYGLNQELYTHFTSPIRRYVDILIHRLLYNSLNNHNVENNKNNNSLDHQLINKINEQCKNIKKAQRDSIKLKKIYELKDKILETFGYVIMINDNKLLVYVPELLLDLTCVVFSKKINVDYVSNENELCIGNIKIKLFDQVKLRIIVSMKEQYISGKLMTQLLEPHIAL